MTRRPPAPTLGALTAAAQWSAAQRQKGAPTGPGKHGCTLMILRLGLQRYQAAAVLGRGGMGEVWSAQDLRLARTVAIKRASPASAAGQRLVVEAEVCARLEHPNIVPVYDAGVDDQGQPWYAMRLVRGRTLQQWLDQSPTLQARLELARPMLAVCQAVGYAHLHGVVHRDLKPANVMIGAHGEVQVLDWGLARRLGCADSAAAEALQPADQRDAARGNVGPAQGLGMTLDGAVLGTPVYMSPEAARGEPVGPAGDVWSLGVMLHQLATGQTPQAGQTAEQQLAKLRQGTGLGQAQGTQGDAPIELLAIVAKALSPLPADRYRDASDLAEDLARWLDGKRIRAHSYTPPQLLGRLVKAWKIPLAVAGVAALLLAGLGAWSVQRIAGQRDRAQAAEATAGLALTRADAALTQALQGAAALAASEWAQPEAEVLATAAPHGGTDRLLRGLLAGLNPQSYRPGPAALPVPACPVGAVGADGSVVFCAQDQQLQAIAVDSGAVRWRKPMSDVTQVRAVAGKVAVALQAGSQRWAVVLDAATGAELARTGLDASMQLHGGHQQVVAANQGWLVALPDGRRPGVTRLHPCPGADQTLLAVALGREDDALLGICDGAVMLADPGTLEWQPVAIADWPKGPQGATAAALQSRDGWLVVGSARGQLTAIDLGRRRWVRELTTAGGMIRDLQWAPAAAEVLVHPERGGVMLWTPQTLAGLQRLPWIHSRIAGFAEDGQILTVADTAHRWQPRPRRVALLNLVGSVGLTSASSRGDLVAGSAGDGSAVVASAATGQELWRIKAMTGVAKRVSFSANGQWLAVSAMASPYLRVFETATWQGAADAGLKTMIRRAEFAKGNLLVVAPVAKGGPMLVAIQAGGLVGPALLSADQGFADAAVAYGGEQAVWLAEPGGEVVQAALIGQPRARLALRLPGAVAADVSANGELLAVATSDEVLLRRGAGQPLVHLGKVACRLMDVALDARAQWVAAPCSQGQIYVWSTANLALQAELHGHTGHAVHVAFEEATGDLLSAGWDGTVRRWQGQALRAPQQELPAAAAQQRWQLTLPQALSRPR